MQEDSFKYYAFISYSHKDKKIAKRLQRRLERYHLPSAIQKSYPELPKKLRPVFIDESDLVPVGSLKTALQANLDRSRYLIVICSPNSAKSVYVNDEVKYFIESGREEQIIPLIVDGEPHAEDPEKECFPDAVLELSRDRELLGISVKVFGERGAFQRVIAAMLRLDLDSFASREERERKKRLKLFMLIAAAVMSVAGLLIRYNIGFINDTLYNDEAQYSIGSTYYSKQDYAKAMEWFRKAAVNGNADAQYNIGYMYHNGQGVAKDYAKALEWYGKAAANGNAAAQNNIGYMYQHGRKLSRKYQHGQGVAQDYAKALEWYEKAAVQENADAQNNIGYMYQHGQGVARDYAKALEWYKKAEANGHVGVHNNLGILYEKGLGVEQDYLKAMEHYQKAADKGNSRAQYCIGYLYEKGLGIEQDYSKAMEYYTKAADQGYRSAKTRLKKLSAVSSPAQ